MKCAVCGKEFDTTNPRRIYCSKKCNSRAKYLRSTTGEVRRAKRNLICKNCGKKFQSEKRAHFCSDECCLNFYGNDRIMAFMEIWNKLKGRAK